MRLIDADSLKGKEVHGTIGDVSGDFIPAFEIGLAPTIEAEPVRHGKWVFDFELAGSNFYKCSVCDGQEVLLAKEDVTEWYPYCHCGAKMDLEEKENR